MTNFARLIDLKETSLSADVAFVRIITKHGPALVEALDQLTALAMATNPPRSLMPTEKTTIYGAIDLLATIEKEAGDGQD